MSFYDQVLREIVAAIGAALLIGNGLALARRRADAKSGGAGRRADELTQAPVGRTVAFMVLGAVMLIAGLAALIAL
jgi:hypothetical protein